MVSEQTAKLVEQSKALIGIPHCDAQLKECAQAWINSVGTPQQEVMAEAYIKELEEDVVLIDDCISFFSSPVASEKFGAETAEKILSDTREAKKSGAKYCICAACAIASSILENKQNL